MPDEPLMPIELALRDAIRSVPESDPISAEQVIEVAEAGRAHPEFEDRMSRIVRSPSALALYRSSRESMAPSGLRSVAGIWMEGLKALPGWFERILNALQSAPIPAYRSGAAQAERKDLRLIDPDPINQSIYPGTQEWHVAGEPGSLSVKVEDMESDAPATMRPGQQVTVTVSSNRDDWSLENEAVYRFRVLTEEEVERADWAIGNRDESPRASAVVLCSLGLFGEAQRLSDGWTNDPEFGTFAELIRNMCEARKADARQFYL